MTSSRRDFVKDVTLAAAGLAMLKPGHLLAATADRKVRLGLIGTGLRGQSHLALALRRKDVDVVAICDVDDKMLQMAGAIITKSGKPAPKVFTGDNYAYRKLLELTDLDGVIIATPWEWHTPMILDALSAGIKYVGTEVILGITLQEHWDVVKAAESHQAHVMMLENVCYRRDVLAVLNMVRQGVFG